MGKYKIPDRLTAKFSDKVIKNYKPTEWADEIVDALKRGTARQDKEPPSQDRAETTKRPPRG